MNTKIAHKVNNIIRKKRKRKYQMKYLTGQTEFIRLYLMSSKFEYDASYSRKFFI